MFIAAYGPRSEKSDEGERDGFLEGLRDFLKGFRADKKVILLRHLNAGVGDVEIDGVIRKFVVPRINDIGKKFVQISCDLCLLIENACFK